MKLTQRAILTVITILFVCSCSLQKSPDSVGNYSGQAKIVTLLELERNMVEVGIELPNGLITSLKTNNNAQIELGKKVKVDRKANGYGTIQN